jgi:hypothetical protein
MRHLPLVFLALLLLWAPLPFGSVTPWGVLVLVVVVVALVAALLVSGEDLALGPPRGVVAGLVGLGLLGFFQASPTAGRWLGFLTAGLAAHVPAALASVSRPSLSLAPALSRQAALGWWTLALLFVVAVVAGRQRSARPVLLAAVLLAAAFQALYGWRQWRHAPHEILGRVVPGPPRLRGTLVNADHLAVMFEIVMATCLAWGWWAWRRSRREPRLGYRLLWIVPPAACWSGAALALLGTGSRAALAAAGLGLAAQSALVFSGRGRWVAPIALLAAMVLGGTMVALRGPTPALGRQLSRPAHEILHSSRFAVWGPALDLWRSSPWIGTGLGTFEEAFPRVQPAELQGVRWGRAHNDPLELLVTGGIAGVALFGFALVCLARRLWEVYRRGQRSAVRATALAALAALPVVALHEGVDFGLTIPANAVLLTVLLGVGVADSNLERERARPPQSR